jgi:hypothetical protein
MANISHSYAEKILQEHPTSIYIFDDEVLNFASTNFFDLDQNLSSITGIPVRSLNTANNFGFITSSVNFEKVAPIVFGSDYSVFFSGSNNTINIPSKGIFTYNGRYNNNTLEFWTKIDKPYLGKRKIVGAYSATDDGNGLYVNQTSFVLQIGGKSGTAYIKDFNRPFLIQIVNTSNSSKLIVNGEDLIYLSLSDTDLKTLTDTEYLSFGQGTYDCISTYTYQIDTVQALRRFGFGHGVSFPDNVVRNFNGKSIVIDYSKSKYAVNYNYTSNASWKQSKTDNIVVNNNYISNYQYNKPTLNSDTKTITDLESTISGTVFNLKSGTMSTAISNLQVEKLNMMTQQTKGFYMHGYYTSLPTSDQVLFKIVNKENSNQYFSIVVNNSTISYRINYQSGTEYEIFSENTNNLISYSSNFNFIIGIDIDAFVTYCLTQNQQGSGADVKNFFSNQSDLIVYVGGDNDLTVSQTSDANIYSVKFLTEENLSKRSSLISSSGTFTYPVDGSNVLTTAGSVANDIVGSYEIKPYQDYLNFTSTGYRLGVFTNGYWKNAIPLSQFCKVENDTVYPYNFIQFNIDYESSLLNKTVSSKKYFDTNSYENSNIKTYITFEPVFNSYQPDSTFTTNVEASSDRTLIPDVSWETTKYEVVDGFIIYPPTGIDIREYNLVMHIDFNVADTENNLIQIQKMQLSSQAYDESSTKLVGTKYGTEIIPYTYNTSTSIYDYNGYNPFLISKRENPYTYMSRDSGIRLVGFDKTVANTVRGIRIPIKDTANISMLQLSIFYNSELDTSSSPFYAKFPNASEKVFEIKAKNKTVEVVLTRTGNEDTAIISASLNGTSDDKVFYFINGKHDNSPTINTNRWYTLGIFFKEPLIFDITGEFNLIGGISIDNLSYYQFKFADGTWNDITSFTWESPLTTTPYSWNFIIDNSYWLNSLINWNTTWNSITSYKWSVVSDTGSWENVLGPNAISSTNMYSMFTGTNRIVGETSITNNLGIIDGGYTYLNTPIRQTYITNVS